MPIGEQRRTVRQPVPLAGSVCERARRRNGWSPAGKPYELSLPENGVATHACYMEWSSCATACAPKARLVCILAPGLNYSRLSQPHTVHTTADALCMLRRLCCAACCPKPAGCKWRSPVASLYVEGVSLHQRGLFS